MQPVEVFQGTSPVILGLPHTGTHVPDDIAKHLKSNGKLLRDTDWHVHELYAGLLPQATTVRATFHRYVIDANRDPSGQSLYPGQNTTGLIPLTDFDDQPLWNEAPDEAETARRLEQFHRPYHAVLAKEIERVRQINGIAILYDCHSIRSTCPFLFEGQLPDFSIGTNDGATCAPEIEEAVRKTCAESEGYTHVVNGRFKGGWTTRHYGRPENGVHAIQMELTQRTHLVSESLPFAYDGGDKAVRLRRVLRQILEQLQGLAPRLAGRAG
ncbi:MAG: N-formylglutamate deformylase [Alphaproteobacteria bacterium]|nr:N-formylglutamate deformylase [Alphaproteobacteria bacterium]MBU0804725.1 N-formylglutamate deformylase [Alphaproteobacteria bacterium]MBU0873185.1 N-formylglutamate deformylase [Alphaproteobacteria bacterium]MBU1403334.1 N-formylglutamate deformylase [Alphaproteobacteria bacterium]MBU1589670.1 N-formylglutamate deformylase [Alphaproteobacteria bacterium]